MAKALAEDNDACYSRKIGVIVVTPNNSIVSSGYNGSPTGCCHCDSPQWLDILWHKLITQEDKEMLLVEHNIETVKQFKEQLQYKKICPRRFLKIPSGKRSELCNCSHAERNAIFNAAKEGVSLNGATMLCWCHVPCWECAVSIIQAGIKRVYYLQSDQEDYSRTSRDLFEQAGVQLYPIKESDIV